MNNYNDVDRVLLKRKWSLAFKLWSKESINQQLLEHLTNDVTYFIEKLKDYDYLYFVENVDEKKVNKVWDNAICLLSEKSFSARHQIFEFIVRAVYDASFLNENEIIYLLERLQNAEDNLLTKKLNICKIDFIWNIIIENLNEIFSTDQQILKYFEQFINGISYLNHAENVFFLARFQNVLTLCSARNFPTFLNQSIYNENLDKEKINFIWNIICKMLVKKNFFSIEQISKFLSEFSNGIFNLSKAENAFFLARLKIAITLCMNFQLFSLHQEILFLSRQIYNDRLLSEEEKKFIYIIIFNTIIGMILRVQFSIT
ncbi:hypothetical protein F8M41_010600 [Gigaspora margarita]|uniref:Uncharacterized protein n=1 Tax=Gigaspora margarita TaxID=4874 RepID=A0A8H4EVA3_GIGMA|nr:hypothetical protein F8M41_010600 [Gigaspora margarita]